MAGYADPQATHNPATGTSPPAAWGDMVRDDIVWLAGDSASGNPKPMCRVYHNANQNVATATETALAMNSERYDVGGMHSTVTNNSRITIPSGGGGVYHVGGTLRWANTDTDGVRIVFLLVNGTTRIAQVESQGTNSDSSVTLACDYKFSAADYVELVVYQNSGSIIAVQSSSAYSPEFWATWQGVG